MRRNRNKNLFKASIKLSRHAILIAFILFVCVAITVISSCNNQNNPGTTQNKPKSNSPGKVPANAWKAPDTAAIPKGKAGEMIRYGKDLLAHTANYFGPNGSIAQLSNGMNCQNCHLDGGTRLFGNNYSIFMASYPKWSDRSGSLQPATRRITDCFNRSLAGRAPDTNGREVRAMLAYMKWLGQGVKKGQKLFGTASEKLPYLDHPADPAKGEAVYIAKCKVCHGSNGAGLLAADKKSYTYPPLWGEHSYNDGAGMYRIGNLAGFVKNNMPFGATYQNPQLTDEEAWNVSAFVNSQPRPHKDQHNDWKNLKNKLIDFPFGPYADKFSEKQHKYGPFKPIKDAQNELTNKKS
jgi:thiosulfate dehydrogenase